ncbi:DUF998 domain-containing protein [Kribbella capetownensis]|uniref:DUF998 domain-containing protein n=1 Tax=Kribbella capetownensis TaxID=1572659 RepID=A0A4R0J181_9ACTN|nr:DUF998 domain-containing protein [Kribbella capetownensis]TCC39100.1 DUF998 domain-containing protein [Kribbella capetownensis]
MTRPPAARDRLLWCGVVAGPLFVLAFLLQGALKGSGYDALRHPVSSLELGAHGWIQVANFLVVGLLTIAFAVGLWRPGLRAGAVLIALWGVGLIGAGLFTTDPVSGFPLGTPASSDYTTSGAVHDAFSLPAFLLLAAAQVVLSRGHGPRWMIYSLLSATAFLVFFFLASAGFSQASAFVDLAGLFQRLTVTIGSAWLVALAVRELRRT